MAVIRIFEGIERDCVVPCREGGLEKQCRLYCTHCKLLIAYRLSIPTEPSK